MVIFYVIAVFAGALVGISVYILVSKYILKGHADTIVEKAQIEAENIKQQKMLQAKEKFLQLKSEHEKQVNAKNAELREKESAVKTRENQLNAQQGELNRKMRDLESQKGQLNAQKNKLDARIAEYDRLTAQVNSELENVAGMTAEEAKKMLVENMKAEARSEAQAYINDTMDEARLNAAKEAKRIVGNREVLVDGKALKDPRAPIGLMDVVTIPKMSASWRMLLTDKGKLTLVPIEESEAGWKLCRIENKTVVKGGRIQLNFHDGRNILLDKDQYKTGDVLKVAFDGQKVLEAYPLASGASALVFRGIHAGMIETVSDYVVVKGPSANVVKFADGTETVKDNVFIIGASAPAIKMPEAS